MNTLRMTARRLSLLLAGALLALGALNAVPASADFGFEKFDQVFANSDGTPATFVDSSPATQAGSHPFAMTTQVSMNRGEPRPSWFFGPPPDEMLRDLITELPVGFIGNPTATPRCSSVNFLNSILGGGTGGGEHCADSTAVGHAITNYGIPDFVFADSPVYNLEPPPGVAAKLGFGVAFVLVTVEIKLRQSPPYNVVATVDRAAQPVGFYSSDLTLWGNPSDPAHDPYRGNCIIQDPFGVPGGPQPPPIVSSTGNCPVSVPPNAFLTMPGTCTAPPVTVLEADSWEHPGAWVRGEVVNHDNASPPNPQRMTGCDKLPFSPQFDSKATSDQAETGTGLDVDVDFDQGGLLSTGGLAQSTVKKAVVTLPEGVTVNPSIGEGLGVCTPADIERETLNSEPGEGCPNSSKIGTLSVDTPLVDEAIEGSVFLAQQDDPATVEPGAENPFDSLIAMYLVLKNANLGTIVKLPAKVEPDPNTGQLVTTLDDIPQVPFSHFHFHFREGARAALVTPNACGAYTTKALFTPWSDPASTRTVVSDFQITRGKGGGACPPGGIPPFAPDFEAGSINNNAASFSPFNVRLLREDGEQDMTKFSSILPPGVLGSLAGVGKCPDAAVAAAKGKTGRQELASPSCPADSEIGHTLAGAGVGTALTYVPGKIYLGGPYNGDPLSVISITPAVAGPFDAGTVAVRLALTLNPKTAEVEVDGANSDPIPHILKGIVLKLRDLRVYVDRPNFILNPTSCDESSARATLFGSNLNVFDPADDVGVDLSTRYQAANCLNLGFKPHLGLKLKGGTRRGGHPGLRAHYRPKAGDANVSELVVRLPRSAFLDQSHIRTICTRVQFAADNCPKAAQYGYIKAWTPLLEEPLQGPVYLRSSNHKLPDLVFDLHGLVDVEVATRIDSVRGGIRARVEDSPDAPLSRVLLNMQGGKKGLIVNSRNLCVKAKRNRANVIGLGHNGKQFRSKPLMQVRCGAKRSHASHVRARVARSSQVG